MPRISYVGEYWGDNARALRALTEMLDAGPGAPKDAPLGTEAFDEVVVCIRCQPAIHYVDRAKVRLLPRAPRRTIGVTVWIKAELALPTAAQNRPILGEAMNRVFSALRVYLARKKLSAANLESIEALFWSSLSAARPDRGNVGAKRPRAA